MGKRAHWLVVLAVLLSILVPAKLNFGDHFIVLVSLI